MANQVYFPHYKQILAADPDSFVIISSPDSLRSFKIKVSELLNSISTNVVADFISTDADNGLVLGADLLLYGENLYNVDGVLTGDRIVDADAKDFSLTGATLITIGAVDTVTLSANDGAGSASTFACDVSPKLSGGAINGTDVGSVYITPTVATHTVTDGTNTSTTSIRQNLTLASTISSTNIATSVNTNLNEATLNFLDPSGIESEVSVANGLTTLRATDGSDEVQIVLDSSTGSPSINLVLPVTSALKVNGDAGDAGDVLISGGTTAPTWQKLKYTGDFAVPDWGAGTTLTYPGTGLGHGLGTGYHNVHVFDLSFNEMFVDGVVLTAININPLTGEVVLNILNNGVAFAGSVYITN